LPLNGPPGAVGIPIDDSDIADPGKMLLLMMEIAQPEAAHNYYALNHAPRRVMVVSPIKPPPPLAHAGFACLSERLLSR
jgi:hypothetical protein